MIDVVRAVVDRVFGPPGESLSVLALGDPSARLCAALTTDGHRVACCPDLQRHGDARHQTEVASTVEELFSVDSHWDLVVAIDGFRRMQEVHPPDRLVSFLEWLSRRCRVLAVEAPRRPSAPDLHDLGPYTVFEHLGCFLAVTEVHESLGAFPQPERPVLVASNHGFLLDGTWIPLSRVTPLLDPDEIRRRRVRTFAVDDRVVKIELASEGYFDRCDALNEAHFLSSASEVVRQGLHLPAVRDVRVGRAVNFTVRDFVRGQPFGPGSCATTPERLVRVVDAVSRLAEYGLFHNDLRPWNLLDDGECVSFVDYAATSDIDDDVQGLPQIVALAGTIAALMSEEVPWGDEFLPTLESLIADAGLVERWPLERLIGEDPSESPWFSLPSVREELCAWLSSGRSMGSADIVTQLIDIVLSVQSGGNEVARG